LICPHCSFKTPKFKSEWIGGERAEPVKGNYSLCLECGGFSIITGPDSLRKAVQSEYDAIKHAPEMLLLGQLRQYAYRLHTESKNKAQAKPKK
jgi:hypothetical protein